MPGQSGKVIVKGYLEQKTQVGSEQIKQMSAFCKHFSGYRPNLTTMQT